MPMTTFLLGKLGLLRDHQKVFIAVAKRSGVCWANVAVRIPEPDECVEALYTSHMLDFLNKHQVIQFLKEARRVLTSGGILRIAVADLRFYVENYLQHKDADQFVRSTCFRADNYADLKTFRRRLGYLLKFLLIGERLRRQWLYDGESLCRLLKSAGFEDPQVMRVGTTMIREPGDLNLHEGAPESVFVEAIKPHGIK
jgi:predicted SAM-dependent methyltransferase